MFAARKSSISEWETFLDEFRATLSGATPQLLAITEQQSEVPRTEDKWSAKQIIGHLIDSAGNNHQRFVRAQFTDDGRLLRVQFLRDVLVNRRAFERADFGNGTGLGWHGASCCE